MLRWLIMAEKVNSKPYRVSKWIMFSCAVVLNAFIIFYSCLDDKTTNVWSRFVSNIFANIINNFTEKEVEIIPVESIETALSDNAYNTVPGYESNEIPLGCIKELQTTVYPNNASNKAIRYSTTNYDVVTLNQSGAKVSIVGMKTGAAVVKAENADKTLNQEMAFNVVDLVAPTTFDASLTNSEIAIGSYETINVSYATDFKNSLYYDPAKLIYESSDTAVATVDNFGVIHPLATGTSIIKVSNASIEKTFNITVTPGTVPLNYEDLSIGGQDFCYENEVFGSNKHQLEITSSNGVIENKEFVWESSNPLLVNVDQNGNIRGYRKTMLQDEVVTIKATNKITGQEVTKEVSVKKELPTRLYTCYIVGEKEVWDHKKITAFIGDLITVKVSYDRTVLNKDFRVEISNEEVANYTNQGDDVVLEFKQEGSVTISIISNIDSSLSETTEVTVIKAGAISEENIERVNQSIRKSIGHAMMFAVTQVFTFLTLFMFFPKKKLWLIALISFAEGLALAAISEIIQLFVPKRSGTLFDVGVDTSGTLIALLITLGVILLVKYIKNKKEKPSDRKE